MVESHTRVLHVEMFQEENSVAFIIDVCFHFRRHNLQLFVSFLLFSLQQQQQNP